MSPGETIAKLEALLARVRMRASEARGPRAPRASADAPVAAHAHDGGEVDADIDLPTLPPPPVKTVSEAPEITVEVEMQDTVLEASISAASGAEPVSTGDRYSSRERLVVAETSSVSESAPEPMRAVEPTAPVLDHELIPEGEKIPEAPASSRRPVAPEPEERLAQMAFGAEEPKPPRHTPPPESGRLPAAPAEEFDNEVTGVRDAAPIESQRGVPPPGVAHELVPQETRAQLVSGEVVTDVIGQAQAFAPSTFVALLEASLGL